MREMRRVSVLIIIQGAPVPSGGARGRIPSVQLPGFQACAQGSSGNWKMPSFPEAFVSRKVPFLLRVSNSSS